MTKCAHCKEQIFIQANGFSGIPKKMFCSKCWQRIDTLWHAEKYLSEDLSLSRWVYQIKLDE